ncbi:MAG: hypothetical protein ACRDU9_01720 [Acidimicrobiia bacterium]
MNRQTASWLAAGISAAGFGSLIAFGASGAAIVFMAILATLMFGGIGWAMRTDSDAAWLPRWVVLGFLAKLAGTLARFWMVAVFYEGGDSYRYYRVGTELALQWREGRVPGLTGAGAFGTQVVEAITGGMFAIFTPDLLGGFVMFSILAYFGQLTLYAGFRRWARPHQLKPYAVLIFLLPTYAFWPSSIGKDALVLFALGGAAYFTARAVRAFELRWILGLALFLGILGFIRIHVAGLVVIGLVAAGVVARLPEGVDPLARIRRWVFVGVALAAGALVLARFPDIFGVDLTGEAGLDAFTSDVVRRTSEAGTVAAGGVVTGPADVPGAIALALFRPFAFEASELQHFFAAAETTLLAGLTIWKVPAMLRSWRLWRANGYVVFCTFFVVAYSIAFSVVRNLGIVARQRGQVLAFFLCLLIAMGWEERHVVKPEIPAIKPPSRVPV